MINHRITNGTDFGTRGGN